VEIIAKEWIETARELGREIPQPKGKLVFAWLNWRLENYYAKPSMPTGIFDTVTSNQFAIAGHCLFNKYQSSNQVV
jgi:hypothetical protein